MGNLIEFVGKKGLHKHKKLVLDVLTMEALWSGHDSPVCQLR